MRTSLEMLAALPADGPWPAHAIALALGAEPIAGLPEILAVLGTSRWSFEIEDADGDQPDAPWIADPCTPVEDEHVLQIVRQHGVTATEVRWFAANEHGPYPQALLATWDPGDRDAILQVLWSDGMGRDPPRVTTLGAVDDWLRGLLEQMFAPDPVVSMRVVVPPPFRAALHATLRDAASLRRQRHPELAAPWLWDRLPAPDDR